MPRNQCDDNQDVACSQSLHAGNAVYVKKYGGASSRYLLVKINPKNVVSCPKDESYQKIRCCELTPLFEITMEQVLETELDSAYAPASPIMKKFTVNKTGQKVRRDSKGRFAPIF
jgi:hypothetical protein